MCIRDSTMSLMAESDLLGEDSMQDVSENGVGAPGSPQSTLPGLPADMQWFPWTQTDI